MEVAINHEGHFCAYKAGEPGSDIGTLYFKDNRSPDSP